MSISVNGQSRVPPGFRFHPTEEELLTYYLRKKVTSEQIDLDVIPDVDLNKLEPWEIQEKCKVGSTPQNDWYFFSHKDKKYPTGTRTNRATAAGFWKATGRDKVIHTSSKRIGMRKTLVFYTGRAPHGQKSDWIMHEYRLDELQYESLVESSIGRISNMNQEGGWVVCRVFKKKNYFHKSMDISDNTKDDLMIRNDGTLDQIIRYMGKSCKQELNNNMIQSPRKPLYNERSVKRPALESYHQQENTNADVALSDWASLDRLVASQLNGQFDTTTINMEFDGSINIGDECSGHGDLWSLASSGSDRIRHV